MLVVYTPHTFCSVHCFFLLLSLRAIIYLGSPSWLSPLLRLNLLTTLYGDVELLALSDVENPLNYHSQIAKPILASNLESLRVPPQSQSESERQRRIYNRL